MNFECSKLRVRVRVHAASADRQVDVKSPVRVRGRVKVRVEVRVRVQLVLLDLQFWVLALAHWPCASELPTGILLPHRTGTLLHSRSVPRRLLQHL